MAEPNHIKHRAAWDTNGYCCPAVATPLPASFPCGPIELLLLLLPSK